MRGHSSGLQRLEGGPKRLYRALSRVAPLLPCCGCSCENRAHGVLLCRGLRAGSWAALPQAGWAQIVAVIAILDNSLFAQDPNREPGDVAGDLPWVRYSDPAVREYKLNAERNNGRAAMMGIIGMMIHEGLTGNPIWPIDYEPGHFPLIPLNAVWPGIFSLGNPYPH